MLGILLFSSLVLMPQFLQTLLGYTSELAGLALSAGGLVLLFETPFVGQLTTKIQARRLIAFGWLALSLAMFYSTRRIDLQMSFRCGRMACALLRSSAWASCLCRSRWSHTSGLRYGKKQLRSRNRELHAQHGKQRGNVAGHNLDRTPFAISSATAGGEREN